MLPLYLFQFLLYSLCIHLFTVFTYCVYYSDLFSSQFRYELQSEYDYIIVGSGTAGSVIAHRLAEETNYTFIMLEAGSQSHFLLDIPIVGPAIHRSLFDWLYETVPQDNACLAMEGRKCRLPQGKIVGGSSKLNNMVHVRGNTSHYVQWFHGKYSEEYIQKHFEFIETKILHLDNLQYESDISNALIDSAKELGFGQLGSEFGLGFAKSKVSQKNGKRWSTSDNLDVSKHVVTNALVENVIIEDNTAKGVNILLADKRKKLLAKKGVILSAGTYNSPKILQLSGIGPSKLLKSLKIPVVKDLPVGENLQDHVSSGLDLVLLDKFPSIGAHDIVNPLSSIQYFMQGKGPLTTPGCEVVGFVSTTNGTEPDIQFMVLPTGISSDRGARLRKSLGITDAVWTKYFAKIFDKYSASIIPIVLHPKSRGTVSITSKDPKQPVLIDPKYLSNPKDRKILINGLKLAKKLIETNSMKAIEAYINPTPFPGCENHPIFSDTYWECYIQHLTLSSYHPVGTCSMGLPGTSVVDNSFEVYGIKSLYIADASVLPTLPSGNINAAVAMMGSVFFENVIRTRVSKEVSQNVCLKDYLLRICPVVESKNYVVN